MGIWAESAKTLKFNNGQLRKKTFFKEIGKSKAVRSSSRLDLTTLQRKSSIIYQRKYKRNLLTRSLIIPFVIVSLFLLLWMIYSNFNLQIL